MGVLWQGDQSEDLISGAYITAYSQEDKLRKCSKSLSKRCVFFFSQVEANF